MTIQKGGCTLSESVILYLIKKIPSIPDTHDKSNVAILFDIIT